MNLNDFQVVLAKFASFKPWPAFIIPFKLIPPELKQQGNDVAVYFLGNLIFI
jgi:hypothetical protein